ncbi:MAG: phage tail sheath family protein [Trueperaceae bacterium]
MPVAPTYPGVYIEEIPSGVRTIVGVPTSVTAFIGSTLRGPTDEPSVINGYGDFERMFGGLWLDSTMSYAVRDFFQNGGGQAVIVRVQNGGAAATVALAGGPTVKARSFGAWGDKLRVRVEHLDGDATLYNLRVKDMSTGDEERHLNIAIDPADVRSIDKVLQRDSRLLECQAAPPNTRPDKNTDVDPGVDPFSDTAPANSHTVLAGGNNGNPLSDAQYTGNEASKTGMYALLKLEDTGGIFNLLCLPPLSRTTDLATSTLSEAMNLCVRKRAMLLVDPPVGWNSVQSAAQGLSALGLSGPAARNAAVFFPRLRQRDPKQEGLVDTFVPCGTVAGIFARTDTQRGVWKAPAGLDAAVNGVLEFTVSLTDAENGQLNPLGINCLRSFPVNGKVIWGSRTLRGADQLADEYKYVPVRRTALFLEETLYRALQWVVFEPNDEPLWAQIRLNVGAFMQSLFRQGAFQGKTPREAYFVKCDRETTTQDDINKGIVNIVVGFAPLKPAEFVIVKLQQMAGQIEV